ncbi:spore maturation protein [Clostridium cellulovorans]|uniref:Spore maturation protein B n=1 Tax=Clostridium cellulovorans (strain ATCC 35296 / DSM 3052 / OCM 3 / 743B) TaxID=573061 RepID=D9SNQ1_CLOC7|nr:spore maturation protein [Clostridium cellulovorans]ADL49922.1 spore maturation protein B [Clostridium cellulovorans 743B]
MSYIFASIIPILICGIVIYGIVHKVKVYEVFVEGAKDGLSISVKIFPYLLAMLLSISIFRSSGAMDYLITFISPIVGLIGLPAEIVPLILIKPLSGSGALGVFAEILKNYGPDTFIGLVASIIMGGTETIFYTITVYYGAINIKKIRHTLWAAVMADITAIIVALVIARFIY